MATDLGKAYVQIIPSAKGIGSSIQKELGGGMDAAGKSAGGLFGSSLVSTLTKVVAAAGVGKILKDSIMAGADLEQSIGGIETLFGAGGAKSVEEYAAATGKAVADVRGEYDQLMQAQNLALDNASKAWQTSGLSANDYMQTVTGFAAALKQSTADETQAAQAADRAVIDMADNANKMGSSMESIQNAYQGFAKQNYTMLDNLKLGYGGTKGEMERLLADATALSGVKYDINNLADVYEAIHVIQEDLGITGTTAKEAAETFTGSFNAMKAAAGNLMANLALGNDITGDLQNLTSAFFTWAHNLVPMVGNILKGLPAVIRSVLSGVIGSLNLAGNNMGEIVNSAIELVTGIGEAIISAAPYLLEAGVRLIAELGKAFLTADWSTIGSNLIQSLDDAMFQAGVEIFGSDTGIIDGIKNSITTGLPALLESGSEILTNIINGISMATPQIWQVSNDIIMGLLQFIVENAPSLLSAGADLLSNVINGIAQNLSMLLGSAAELTSNLLAYIMQNAPTLLASGVELVGQVGQSILDNLPTIASSAVDLVAELLGTIIEHAPDVLAGGVELIGQIVAGLIQAIPDVLNTIWTMTQDIIGKITEVDWLQVGADILGGIAKGISGAVGEVLGAVGNVAGSIKNKFTGLFQIGSPSKVMADLAQWIPVGIAKGITDNASVVTDAMKSIRADAMAGLTPGTIQATAVQTVLPAAGNDQAMTEALQALADQQTEVKVVLQGDAAGVFKLVRQENNKTTKATGYNLLAMAGA